MSIPITPRFNSTESIKFLNRAGQVTSLNFIPSDFQSIKFKQEIRYLVQFFFIKDFDEKKHTIQTLSGTDTSKLNKLIRDLHSISYAKDPSAFRRLFKYGQGGIGPGEFLLYIMINDAHINGSNESFDLTSNRQGYEIKAAKITTRSPELNLSNILTGFETGGTVPVEDIISSTKALGKSTGVHTDNTNEIGMTKIAAMSKKSPKLFNDIFESYKDLVYTKYFSKHPFILFDNRDPTLKDPLRMGQILYNGIIKKKNIVSFTISRGAVKPVLKL